MNYESGGIDMIWGVWIGEGGSSISRHGILVGHPSPVPPVSCPFPLIHIPIPWLISYPPSWLIFPALCTPVPPDSCLLISGPLSRVLTHAPCPAPLVSCPSSLTHTPVLCPTHTYTCAPWPIPSPALMPIPPDYVLSHCNWMNLCIHLSFPVNPFLLWGFWILWPDAWN